MSRETALDLYVLTKHEETILTKDRITDEDIVDLRNATNSQLKRIIEKIEVDKNGQVEIYLKSLNSLRLSNAVTLPEKNNTDSSQNFVWVLK